MTAQGEGADRAEPDTGSPTAGTVPTPAVESMVVLDHVVCGYGSTAVLHDVSLSLGSGFHVLIGPNGSGKTTLFRCVAGILLPSKGSVTTRAGRNIGYAMHRSAFSSKMTLMDNLRYWSILFGSGDQTRIVESLRFVDLEDRAHQKVGQLSRGLVQRLAVARALLTDAEVLLLDEPLSGVDPSAVEKLLVLFQKLGDSGKCVVVSTHELAELNEMSGDVIVLQNGTIVGQGTPGELLAKTAGDHPIRWRIAGGAGLREAIQALGLTLTGGSVADNVAEFYVKDDAQAGEVNRELTDQGVSVRSSSAVVDDLTRLYRLLEDKKAS
ncbi:MAG: ABC transporter ATP-binding protein [Propionibacteriaceae bacterium]|jgi:ABC-2 type transport system ATP-binding protein|nr:ABC transporter ATP-binding protein [Propionibacteriaceae bacterium]